MADLRARLSGVSKIFGAGNGAVHALGPLDLDLAAGEFVTIVGPSGCGKTTLLETLAGLTAPTDGTVSFEGKPVGDEVPAGVGVVFQEDASFPWLNVWDNIAFGLRRAGVMSARPGRFIELIETGWPASRSSAIVAEEAFGKLTAHVWSRLRGESLRALGRTEAEPAGGVS